MTTVAHLNSAEFKQAFAEGRATIICRPSKWGNPYVIGKDGTRVEVIALYRQYLLACPPLLRDLPELEDQVLGCYCAPLACHGDVLAELVNARGGRESHD